MIEFNLMQKHQHKTNKTVRDALKQVGKELKTPYSDVLELFRNGNEGVTISFWDLIYKNPENREKYNRVDFCHGCKKFNLFYVAESN